MPAAIQTCSRQRPGKMQLNSCRSSGGCKRGSCRATAGRRSHKSPVFTQGCVAVMHFAQGEKIAFVLPGPPGAGSAPSGALCQLRLSLFALFICLVSERAAGGTGNCLDPVAPHILSLLPIAAAWGARFRALERVWGGFWSFFHPFLPISKVEEYTQVKDFHARAATVLAGAEGGWGQAHAGLKNAQKSPK